MFKRAAQKVRARQETQSPSKEHPRWQHRAGMVLEKQTKGPHAGSRPRDALGPEHQHMGETEPDAQAADAPTTRCSSSVSAGPALWVLR